MMLRVEQGKRRKDRYAILSPKMLKLLRVNGHRSFLKSGHLKFPKLATAVCGR